jgi:hypothetical protein
LHLLNTGYAHQELPSRFLSYAKVLIKKHMAVYEAGKRDKRFTAG